MKLNLFLICILLINFLSAYCSEEQIDINSASAKELEQFTGIGPVKAQAIIDARPFNSVDELIEVNGIGPVTLENMKNSGACVEDENFRNEEEKENEEKEEYIKEFIEVNYKKEPSSEKEIFESKKAEIINLEPKDIKEESRLKKINKGDYAVYGFIIFSALLCFLFVLKWRKGKDEIE